MSRDDVYQIKTRSGMGRLIKPINKRTKPPKLAKVKEVFPEVKPVQNIMPDSKEEYWVALALWKLHIDFIFQYQFMGGRKYHGGQVIDFWVLTVPLPTPVLVQGWYFHYGTAEKAAQSRLNIMYLTTQLRGKANPPVEVFDTEMLNPDEAYKVIKRKLALS